MIDSEAVKRNLDNKRYRSLLGVLARAQATSAEHFMYDSRLPGGTNADRVQKLVLDKIMDHGISDLIGMPMKVLRLVVGK